MHEKLFLNLNPTLIEVNFKRIFLSIKSSHVLNLWYLEEKASYCAGHWFQSTSFTKSEMLVCRSLFLNIEHFNRVVSIRMPHQIRVQTFNTLKISSHVLYRVLNIDNFEEKKTCAQHWLQSISPTLYLLVERAGFGRVVCPSLSWYHRMELLIPDQIHGGSWYKGTCEVTNQHHAKREEEEETCRANTCHGKKGVEQPEVWVKAWVWLISEICRVKKV